MPGGDPQRRHPEVGDVAAIVHAHQEQAEDDAAGEDELLGELNLHHVAEIGERGVAEIEAQRNGSDAYREINREQQHRSEEHTSELQSLMRISYAVFCLKKKKQ